MTYFRKYTPVIIYIIFSIVLFLIVVVLPGCKSIVDAPISHLYVIDTQHNICSVRKITDKNKLSSMWIKDLSLDSCDGVVGLSIEEYLKLRTYMRNKE